jgi:hypothetical protein
MPGHIQIGEWGIRSAIRDEALDGRDNLVAQVDVGDGTSGVDQPVRLGPQVVGVEGMP